MPRRSAMHAQPQRTLKRIVKQYGRDLVHDTRRTEALLRDLSGQHPREIFVLVNAQKQRVPAELLSAPSWLPYQAVHSRLSRQLQQRLAITEDAADWAVNAWATALEIRPSQSVSLWGRLSSALPKHSPSTNARRQDKRSGVQSKPTSGRRSTRQRARAQRAELGWRFPAIGVTIPPLAAVRRQFRGRSGWIAGGALLAFVVLALVGFLVLNQPIGGETGVAPLTGEASPEPAEPAPAGADEVVDASGELPELDPNALLQEHYPTPRFAQVGVDGLLIRQGPSTSFEWVTVLSLREAVRVVGYSEDGLWSEVDQPRLGWVSNDYLTFQSPNEGESVQLRVRQARTRNYEAVVRAAPRPDAPVVASLPPNQPVIVIAISANSPNNWLQIAGPTSGWLATQDALWPSGP